jgi:hypothetical protein
MSSENFSKLIFIDALAIGYSIELAAQVAKMPLEAANKLVEEIGPVVKRRREELQSRVLLSPAARLEKLSDIVRMSLEGYLRKDSHVVTPEVAVQAIRVMNEMLKENVPVYEQSNIIAEMIRELFAHGVEIEAIRHAVGELLGHDVDEAFIANYVGKHETTH